MRTIAILSCAIWGGPIVLATLGMLPALVSARYRRLIGEYLVGNPGTTLPLDSLAAGPAEGN